MAPAVGLARVSLVALINWTYLRALSQSQSRFLAVQAGQTGGRIRVGSGRRADSFQAGHAASILVTRSTAKALVRSPSACPSYSNKQITRMARLVMRIP